MNDRAIDRIEAKAHKEQEVFAALTYLIDTISNTYNIDTGKQEPETLSPFNFDVSGDKSYIVMKLTLPITGGYSPILDLSTEDFEHYHPGTVKDQLLYNLEQIHIKLGNTIALLRKE